MKIIYLALITMTAWLTSVAFRAVLQFNHSKTTARIIAEKKKFALRCSPLYLPSPGDDMQLLTGWGN